MYLQIISEDVTRIHKLTRILQKWTGLPSEASMNISSSPSLEAAAEALETGPCDVILLDLSLKDSQGLRTFERMHSLTPMTPIIVLGRDGDEDIAVEAIRLGAQDFLGPRDFSHCYVTRSIRFATERKKFDLRMRQKEKIDGVNAISGGFAHDLNNLIHVILGYTRSINDKISSMAGFDRHLEKIISAATQSSTIINQLMSYADPTLGAQSDASQRDLNSSHSDSKDKVPSTAHFSVVRLRPIADQARVRRMVLVADDDEDVLFLTESTLQEMGIDVIVAKDGRMAVELFERMRDQIDLVLLDYAMPEMNGDEACRRIRNLAPDVPVILCSGYRQSDIAAIHCDDVEFIQKPYQPECLSMAIRHALGGMMDAAMW